MVMNLTLEIHEIIERLDDKGKLLLLEVAKRFLPDDWDDEELSDNDLYHISLAKEEHDQGKTISHSEVFKDLI